MKKAYLFPGQGSQKTGMGADHYRFNSEFRKRCDAANDLLGYRLTEIMFDGPDSELTQTRYTQPALFVHAYALYEVLGHKPDMVAGHSLGEYTALAASGVLAFEEALRAVQRRGELMQDAGESQPGSMAAIIGLDDEIVENICSEVRKEPDHIVIPANYNTRGQLVISGHIEAVDEAMEKLREAGAKIVKKLPVSGAFHSALMSSAREELDTILDTLDFREPTAGVYSNVSGTVSRDPGTIRDNLKQQLLKPVRWVQTLNNMHQDGAVHYVEVGSGNVLQGLVKRTLSGVGISGFQ
jgi:[acyl-carrier-protein] S-malonyltransferase